METLFAVQNLLSVHALVAEPVIAQSSAGLVSTIRNFVGPLLMLVCGFAAMGFLFSRQTTQFIIFTCIAVGVFAIFYAPELLKNLGENLGQNNSTW